MVYLRPVVVFFLNLGIMYTRWVDGGLVVSCFRRWEAKDYSHVISLNPSVTSEQHVIAETGLKKKSASNTLLVELEVYKLPYQIKGTTSSLEHFEKSSFPIQFNLLHPQPYTFLFVLESTLWCFSSLANHYF